MFRARNSSVCSITKSFVDFNGVVPEKYDVVSLTHKVQVEYGNVGVDFKYVPREGFGWMNASYQIGLSIITKQMRRALGTCTSPDVFFERTAAAAANKRQQVVETAKAITQNGQTTAAITVIVPPESSVILNNGLKRKAPSLSPDTSQHDLASYAIDQDDDHTMDSALTTPEDEFNFDV